MGFLVLGFQGFVSIVQGLGFGVWGLEFRACELGLKVNLNHLMPQP